MLADPEIHLVLQLHRNTQINHMKETYLPQNITLSYLKITTESPLQISNMAVSNCAGKELSQRNVITIGRNIQKYHVLQVLLQAL